MQTDRESALKDWVQTQLQNLQPNPGAEVTLSMVSGDASFRRYFRASADTQNYIAVDAPPQNEDSELFVRVDELFQAGNVRVPQVYAADFKQGFMLLEDFGDVVYLEPLQTLKESDSHAEIDKLYRGAIDALVNIQRSVNKECLDPYDRAHLCREMALFEEWFCRAFLQMQLSEHDEQIIARAIGFLADSALAQETVAVHRDYHSRNLMFMAGESGPGIIDFQDAVNGPYTYDLVSLLRDCYISWPGAQVEAWSDYYLTEAQAVGIAPAVSAAQFTRDLDLMGLQRNLKVLGIFCRLFIRDKKTRYLANIPLVIHYFMEITGR